MDNEIQRDWSPYFDAITDPPQTEEFMSEVMDATFNHFQELIEDDVIAHDGMEDAASQIFPVVMRLLSSTFISEASDLRFNHRVPVNTLLMSDWADFTYPFTDEEQAYSPVDYLLGRVPNEHYEPTYTGIEAHAELLGSFADTLSLRVVELATGEELMSPRNGHDIEIRTHKRALVETGGYIFIEEDGIYGAFNVVEPGEYEIRELEDG